MSKFYLAFGLFALIIFMLTSCSRHLRPSANSQKKPVDNANKTVAQKPKNFRESFDSSSFSGNIIKSITYTTALNYKGVEQDLALDIYKPANSGNKKYPAIFLMHGGSFIGGDKNNLAYTCSKLAANGYVVISVNYRLGWGFVSRATASCNDTVLLKQAMYRAVQDVHTAMNYVMVHADEYNIDKDWVFIGGQSAGAVIALLTAYLNDEDANTFFRGFSKQLGALNKSVSNDFTIKGVISMWGALVDPELIKQQTALPTIFFQGELDRAIPFKSGPFAPCDSATIVYGTYPLYNRLKSFGVTAIAHVDPQGGHGVFEEDFRIKNILCFLNDVKQGIKKQVYLTGVQNSCDK